MKIGILTFWWSRDNYGQILQVYALQKYLKDNGHEVFLINYDFHTNLAKLSFCKKCIRLLNPRTFLRLIKSKVNRFLINHEDKYKSRHFDDFRNNYIQKTSLSYKNLEELQKNPPQADLYIVGSDQVWNPQCIGNENNKNFEKILNVYFLNFGTAKKMSYAASFGRNSLSQNYINIVSPLLQKFNLITVREKSGLDLCKQLGCNNAKWVCDPTMLLTADRYRELYNLDLNIRKIDKPYLLLYILNNHSKMKINKIFQFAKKQNLEVVYIIGNNYWDKRKHFYASIFEWLYLIDNAKYVITNSFHCGVFSTIFEKQYGIIPVAGKYYQMNSRFESLFNLYKINPRYLNENDLSILETPYEPNFENYFDLNDAIKFL